jgi:hypothetical protein
LYEKKLHERKEKGLKALGLARDMTQSYFGFFWGQDPTQMCSVGHNPTEYILLGSCCAAKSNLNIFKNKI